MLSWALLSLPMMDDFVFTWGSRPISGREAVPGSPPYITGLGPPVSTVTQCRRPGGALTGQVIPIRFLRLSLSLRLDVLGLSAHFFQACKVSSGWLGLPITPGFLSFLERVEKTKSWSQSLLGSRPGLASYSVEILGKSFSNARPRSSNQ